MASTAIVVLGQSLNPTDGSPPNTLRSRVATAGALWRDQPDALLICSGGDPVGTGKAESSIMFEFIEKQGVPKNARHVLEKRSMTTVGNAVECVPILRRAGVMHIDLVSSEFHLPRAMYFFEAVLAAHQLQISVVPIPAPTPPPSADDVGINAETLEQRIIREERFCSLEAEVLEVQLKRFNPNRSVPIPPLPAVRKEQALAELRV